jgi:hypothetical protein
VVAIILFLKSTLAYKGGVGKGGGRAPQGFFLKTEGR